MAQVLKLKRTAVQGKVPNTSSLELGELAINTFDGKIYFEKDNGTPSVETILVTDSTTTGSINLIGAVSASYFKGDGSALTNLPNADVSQVATVTASFDNQSNINVVHNFDTRNILVSVYDTAYSQIIPSSVTLTNNNSVDITLSAAQSGFAVVAKGGHIVSGTLVQEVTEVATISASFDTQSTISVTHNFNSKNIIVSVYDSNDSQIIPSSVTLTDLDTTTIILSSPQSGYVVVAKGGHLVTATGTISYNNLTDIPSGIISGSASVPAGTVSGSSQLTSSYDERYVLSGSITQTTWDNIASKPNGIVSGSIQVLGGTNIISGSSQIIYNSISSIPSGIVSGSSQIIDILDSLNTYTASVSSASLVTSIENLTSVTASYATTGSNLFRGTQTHSGSIVPATDNTYDLGSPTYQWRDIYVSSGSLYIDGTKVLSSTNQELQITTDTGQSIKILEEGSDSIILQSVDGDIQLKSSGGGNLLFDPTSGLLDVRGTLQIQDGNKITSSGGTTIQFGNDLGITGSINTSGNVNGINLSTFSSSVASTFSNQNSATSSYARINSTNTFNGTQTISGSLFVTQDLIILGSSSIQNVSSSTLNIGTNIITVATNQPSVRFGGLAVIDSGSAGGSGSILYDSVEDEFVFLHRGNGINITSSHFLMGPETIDNLGNEIYLTNNRVPKGTGKEHLNDSNISDTGTLITLGSNSVVTGTLLATGTTLVSSSEQVVGILNSVNTYTSSQDNKNSTLATYTGSVDTKFTTLGTYTASLETKNSTLATYTGSLETKNSTLATYTGSVNSQLSSLITATSSYETRGRGIVSGSSQVDVMSTTNISRLATTGSNTFTTNQNISTTRTNGSNTNVLTLSDNVTGVQTPGFGLRIQYQSNGTGVNAAIGLENGGGGTNNESQISLYTQNTAGALTRQVLVGSTGNLTVTGTITENSSLRYKENIETIKYGLDKVLQMRGVTYDKKDNGVKEIGVIAEEIYEVLPELVLKNEEGEIDSVSYGRITAVLIEAIKDLKKEIEDLKANR